MNWFKKMFNLVKLNKRVLDDLDLYHHGFVLAVDPKIICTEKKIIRVNTNFLKFIGEEEFLNLKNINIFEHLNINTAPGTYFKKINTFTKVNVPTLITVFKIKRNKEDLFFITIKDLTELEATKSKLNLFLTASSYLTNGIIITDYDGIIQWVNKVVIDTYGYTEEDLIGQKTSIFKSKEQDNSVFDNLWNSITTGSVWQANIINKKKDNTLIPVKLTIIPIFNGLEITNYVGVQELSELEDKKSSALASSERLKEFFNITSAGVCVLEKIEDTFIVDYINEWAEQYITELNVFANKLITLKEDEWFNYFNEVLLTGISSSKKMKLKDIGVVLHFFTFKLSDSKLIFIFKNIN